MDDLLIFILFFRKQEHNKYKENKIETETIISPKHTDDTTEKILLFNKSFNDMVPQPLQKEKVVKSDCKVTPKLTHNIQKISADTPINLANLQLPSEQYISIFNRYQVCHTIIILIIVSF